MDFLGRIDIVLKSGRGEQGEMIGQFKNFFSKDDNSIEGKLKKLQKLDSDLSVFGASSHCYKTNPPLSKKEIEDFEFQNGIQLPEEYKYYLGTIGNGGVGPFYGLYALENNDGNHPDLRKSFSYNRKMPLVMAEFYDQIPSDISEEEHERLLEEVYAKADSGIIFLATEGCGMYSVLVVNGEEYGNVWYYDLANDAGLYPLINPVTGTSLNFKEWYELWLNCSLEYFSKGKKTFQSYSDFIV